MKGTYLLVLVFCIQVSIIFGASYPYIIGYEYSDSACTNLLYTEYLEQNTTSGCDQISDDIWLYSGCGSNNDISLKNCTDASCTSCGASYSGSNCAPDSDDGTSSIAKCTSGFPSTSTISNTNVIRYGYSDTQCKVSLALEISTSSCINEYIASAIYKCVNGVPMVQNCAGTTCSNCGNFTKLQTGCIFPVDVDDGISTSDMYGCGTKGNSSFNQISMISASLIVAMMMIVASLY